MFQGVTQPSDDFLVWNLRQHVFFLNGCHINWPPFSVEKPGVFSWRSQWSNGGRRYPAKICSRAPGFKVERCEDIAGPHCTDHRGICGWKMMELVGTAGETIPEILRGPWRSVGLASSWLEWLSQYFPDPPGSRNSRDSRWVHHFKQQFLKVCLSIDFMISIIRLVFMVLNHCYFSIGPLSNFWYPVTPVTWPTSFFSKCVVTVVTWHDMIEVHLVDRIQGNRDPLMEWGRSPGVLANHQGFVHSWHSCSCWIPEVLSFKPHKDLFKTVWNLRCVQIQCPIGHG